MMSWAIEHKIARLRAGGKPRVLDLFAGCGGLSLGFQAGGFEVVAAVENDPDAARSHGLNLHGGTEEYPTLVADDNLHPSGKVYTPWADTIVPLAELALLKEETP